MKKLIAIAVVILFGLTYLTGCTNQQETYKPHVKVTQSQNSEYVSFMIDTINANDYYYERLQSSLNSGDYLSGAFYAEKLYNYYDDAKLRNYDYVTTGLYSEMQDYFYEYLSDVTMSNWYTWKAEEYASEGNYDTASTFLKTGTSYTREAIKDIEKVNEILDRIG